MINVAIDKNVPMPAASVAGRSRSRKVDAVEQMLAASRTLRYLMWAGKKLRFDEEARDTAGKILMIYAGHPLQMGTMTDKELESHSAASMALAGDLLQSFGQSMVSNAAEVRNLITNKLIVETDNPDPKVRLKALEMLGKISDVGLFTEKSEITITHQSDTDLKRRLREKLERLRAFEAEANRAEDAIVVEEELDELGLPAPQHPASAKIIDMPRVAEPQGPFDDD